MKPTIAIVDYQAGNIRSLHFALERLGARVRLTGDPEQLRRADKVILPGVGAAGPAMARLRETGLGCLLAELEQPLLGICLGMQLLCRHSAEGDTPALGLFPASVCRLEGAIKVPHMGWNTLHNLRGPLFTGLPEGVALYFVHSYYAPCGPDTIACMDYGGCWSAALQREHIFGLQCHPEKSGEAGHHILKNFMNL